MVHIFSYHSHKIKGLYFLISVFENWLSSGMTPFGRGCQVTVHIRRPDTILPFVMAEARSVSKLPCLGSFPRSIMGNLGASNKLGAGIITPFDG